MNLKYGNERQWSAQPQRRWCLFWAIKQLAEAQRGCVCKWNPYKWNQTLHNYVEAQLCGINVDIYIFALCSVKTQFASSRVRNKEARAKGAKVREVIREGGGEGCEQNSCNVPAGRGLNLHVFPAWEWPEGSLTQKRGSYKPSSHVGRSWWSWCY